MRLSPLMLAISVSLLAACQPANTRDEAAAAAAHEQVGENAAVLDAVEVSAARESVGKLAAGALRSPSPPPVLASPALPSATGLSFKAAPMPSLEAAANTERYADHEDNPLHLASEQPVSTFSIDVDTGSYSNVRRMLKAGQRPPSDAVRAEEMINYFDYGYPVPSQRGQPFSVTTELATAPWNHKHQLLQIGIQGYRVPAESIPAANLVFLIDTSGSMQDEDKLPLLKRSFAELTRQLRAQDRVSIVVYAGSAGLVLAPTPGDRKDLILAALDRLEAGGSTNGGEGLKLAYDMARQAFLAKGVNRVLLATDGDFNVGTVDQTALETMVADQRKSGIALTTLGFGTRLPGRSLGDGEGITAGASDRCGLVAEHGVTGQGGGRRGRSKGWRSDFLGCSAGSNGAGALRLRRSGGLRIKCCGLGSRRDGGRRTIGNAKIHGDGAVLGRTVRRRRAALNGAGPAGVKHLPGDTQCQHGCRCAADAPDRAERSQPAGARPPRGGRGIGGGAQYLLIQRSRGFAARQRPQDASEFAFLFVQRIDGGLGFGHGLSLCRNLSSA